MTYNFLEGEEDKNCSTIFTLTGNVLGYDITLFNYYDEIEILLEPERKFRIDEIIPPINNIIHIRCDMQYSSLILDDNLINNNNSLFEGNSLHYDYDYILKYILVGDASAKKTKFLSRFCYDDFKSESHIATVGAEFGAKVIKIGNQIFKIQIWDTAGQEGFRSITRSYYKGSKCAIIMYNITDRNSFENIPTWIEECKYLCPLTVMMVLVGNISEKEDKREVSYEEGKLLADKYGIPFYEVSCKTGENVNKVFYDSVNEIARKINEGYYDLKAIQEEKTISMEEKKEKQNNCIII